ncbi:hypothetical protein LWI29_009696 [Acer saccharum]|uniref:Uncharacterized protein n=1 Tax=Acer saccharum TaxID=4024 RepID=A0AA39S7Z5_ACESA|nr:hypothetical protein LWI29_009696 [Acer saccharum]
MDLLEYGMQRIQLSLINVLGSELAGFKTASASAPVSALEFCSSTLSLAIGNACVHVLPQGDGPQCLTVASFLNSPICNLQFADFRGRLAVGFQCGRVAMLDISTLSVLFLTDSISYSSSPVRSLAVKSFSDTNSIANSTKDPNINTSTVLLIQQRDTAPGILSGIVKGFKAGKVEHKVDLQEISNSTCAHLDHIFSYPPFLKPHTVTVKDYQDVVELNIGSLSLTLILLLCPLNRKIH